LLNGIASRVVTTRIAIGKSHIILKLFPMSMIDRQWALVGAKGGRGNLNGSKQPSADQRRNAYELV
jgi:hypothetical protein